MTINSLCREFNKQFQLNSKLFWPNSHLETDFRIEKKNIRWDNWQWPKGI